MEIRNKNTIITGAASGVGKELTKQITDKIEIILQQNLSNIKNVSILGAIECQIAYLKRNYRFRG